MLHLFTFKYTAALEAITFCIKCIVTRKEQYEFKHVRNCILSMAEQKSSEELQCILNKIEKFSELKNVEMAKSYLSETWNIAGSITSFQAGAGCQINVKENGDLFVVNFVLNDENISYYYNK